MDQKPVTEISNTATTWPKYGKAPLSKVYQELTGLPKGSYTISVQAYNRQGANADIASSYNAADPKKDVLSYLFGNDAKEKLHHLI